jgi:hypothetical protein
MAPFHDAGQEQPSLRAVIAGNAQSKNSGRGHRFPIWNAPMPRALSSPDTYP